MLWEDLVAVSFRFALRNRVRALAAMIGTCLGIAGVITTYTLGGAIDKAIGYDLELVGRAVILRASYDFDRLERWHHGKFTERELAALRSISGVDSVSPYVATNSLVFFRDRKEDCLVMGAHPDIFETLDLKLLQGRQIDKADIALRRPVCVLGRGAVSELFADGSSAIGNSVSVNGLTLRVVGLLGGLEYQDFHHCLIMPISVAQASFREIQEIRNIYIRAESWDAVPGIRQSTLKVLQEGQPGYADSIEVEHFPERIKTLKKSVFLVQVLLWASWSVVLSLSCMGILSLMLASVQERTREIGLRRSVGASQQAILGQFFAETVAVSLVGSFHGLVLGFIMVEALKHLLAVEAGFHRFVVGCALGLAVGVLIGLAAGMIPARKASRLDIVEAMRFE